MRKRRTGKECQDMVPDRRLDMVTDTVMDRHELVVVSDMDRQDVVAATVVGRQDYAVNCNESTLSGQTCDPLPLLPRGAAIKVNDRGFRSAEFYEISSEGGASPSRGRLDDLLVRIEALENFIGVENCADASIALSLGDHPSSSDATRDEACVECGMEPACDNAFDNIAATCVVNECADVYTGLWCAILDSEADNSDPCALTSTAGLTTSVDIDGASDIDVVCPSICDEPDCLSSADVVNALDPAPVWLLVPMYSQACRISLLRCDLSATTAADDLSTGPPDVEGMKPLCEHPDATRDVACVECGIEPPVSYAAACVGCILRRHLFG